MRLYLDTSVIVGLLSEDLLAEQAKSLAEATPASFVVSDLARAEFHAVIGRRLRSSRLTADEARAAFDLIEGWTLQAAQPESLTAGDVETAIRYLRRPELGLRTQDAMHIAIADRIGASLATFDRGMATAARALGVVVVTA